MKNLKESEFIGIFNLMDETKQLAVVKEVEDGFDNHDFCLGRVDYRYNNYRFFKLPETEVLGLDDVISFGFPKYLFSNEEKTTFIVQFQKGYVTRIVTPEFSNLMKNPDFTGYLVNFPFPLGMSGSPVYLSSNNELVGIALGNIETKTQIWELSSYKDDRKSFEEVIHKVIELGLVLDIKQFLGWNAKILHGRFLKDLFNSTKIEVSEPVFEKLRLASAAQKQASENQQLAKP